MIESQFFLLVKGNKHSPKDSESFFILGFTVMQRKAIKSNDIELIIIVR